MKEHNDGIDVNSYTYSRRPVELKFSYPFDEIYNAIMAEKRIKKWSRGKKQALIEGDFELLKKLSECKNESNYRNYRKGKNGITKR